MTNQPHTVLIDKQRRKVVVIDVPSSSDGNFRKKEHEKLKKYKVLREELEKMCKLKGGIGALGIVTPKLG